MRKRYPSDISRETFEEIHPLLESARKQTKPVGLIYMKSSAQCSICSKAVANGGCYRANTRNGGQSIRILPNGVSLIQTEYVTNRQGALLAFKRPTDNLQSVKRILVDGGYTGQPFADAVSKLLGAQVQIAKRSELHTFAVMPKRWVVERSFAWLEKCRRLWKNCERKLNTSLQFINMAFIALILKRS